MTESNGNPLPPDLEDLAQREGHAPDDRTQQQRRDAKTFNAKIDALIDKAEAIHLISRTAPENRIVLKMAGGLVLQQIQHVRIELDGIVEDLKTRGDEDLVEAFHARREVGERLHLLTYRLTAFVEVGDFIAARINDLVVSTQTSGGS